MLLCGDLESSTCMEFAQTQGRVVLIGIIYAGSNESKIHKRKTGRVYLATAPFFSFSLSLSFSPPTYMTRSQPSSPKPSKQHTQKQTPAAQAVLAFFAPFPPSASTPSSNLPGRFRVRLPRPPPTVKVPATISISRPLGRAVFAGSTREGIDDPASWVAAEAGADAARAKAW